MPTYEYACTECGDRLEVVQRFSDDPLTLCTSCGGGLRKVFSPVGIVFKGSGFYRTDSRGGPVSAGANGKAGSDGASSSGSDGASSGKTAGAATGAASSAAKSNGNGSAGESGKGSAKAESTGASSKVA